MAVRKKLTKEEIMKAFKKKQAEILLELVEMVDDVVKAKDFNELKEIVRELAEAQKNTEQRMNELAEAQKRTEQRVNELAEAQKRTEEEIRQLANSLNRLRVEFGGFQRSMSYAFENEAFRMLPGVLKEKYGIEVTERFIRKEVRGKEINVFGRGRMNGKDVLIVGEAKIRLEEKGMDREEKREWIEKTFDELEDKVRAVQEENRGIEIVRILITHFATSTFLEEARRRGVIVIQSFEW